MNLKKFVITGLILSCFSPAIFAEDDDLTKQFSSCLDKANGVTSEMLDCIGTETKYQDERLNKAYKELLPLLSAERKKELQETQRLWIKYRDANSHFYADPDGGTMATITSNDTFLTTTASRAKELEELKKLY
ncbi:MAG: lysozyme inhibitor LprI family protein [Methylococcales bacterium]|nr:lysozyme inhibitor LprI family protein [Methylococcales bacterium]MDD5753199.1 lysozyme inhibitor LprI family protein [Methylococcales bacterium]